LPCATLCATLRMAASALRSHTNFPLDLAGWAVKAWGQDLVRELKLKVYRHWIGFNPERLCKGMGCAGLVSKRAETDSICSQRRDISLPTDSRKPFRGPNLGCSPYLQYRTLRSYGWLLLNNSNVSAVFSKRTPPRTFL
jgi:hypothetical protein